MSYHNGRGGGGGRRRYRDDYHDRREPIVESPETQLKNTILKLGEVDPSREVAGVARTIRESEGVPVAAISEAFRTGVTEQPFKIPYYAALLRLLHDPSPDQQGHPLGKLVLEDFWKGFQAYLDKLAWREIRLCIHFFAHLTVAKLISAESMIDLLQSFVKVLDEFGASYARAKKAALCAAEGLMIGGSGLKRHSPTDVTDMIQSIQTYFEATTTTKWLVDPICKDFSDSTSSEFADELLDSVVSTLQMFDAADFTQTSESFVQPYTSYPDHDPTTAPFVLPTVLVPPELIELDSLSTESATVKKDEWPEYFLRIFDHDVTPDTSTPAGYAVRSALLDIISIYEVNRKECARLLLEYPKWAPVGTFKPKTGTETPEGKNWQLDNTIVETILGLHLLLPESPYKSIYYISLLTELCKLSPATVGPAVGKSIRKLYSILPEGIDPELSRKFSEWFAIHMSNFNFQWVWKEWVPDLSFSAQHPKRTFMRRAVESEVRLAYHDRVLKTLPEAMHTSDAQVIAEQSPGPEFDFDHPAHPHHEAAQSVLNLLRGRAKSDEVIAHIDTLRGTIDTTDADPPLDTLLRRIAVQSLLQIGARSFSHLLNAMERYLPLLRHVAASGGSSSSSGGWNEAKMDILSAAAAFWRQNTQLTLIVFDKIMQYQVVDPSDVVVWTFLHSRRSRNASSDISAGGGGDDGNTPRTLTAFEWELLRAALDKANGRVVIARRKVLALKKEEDERKAREKASDAAETAAMEVDADAKPEEPQAEASAAMTTAQSALSKLTTEQRSALSHALDGFIACLHPDGSDAPPNPHVLTVIAEAEWANHETWGDTEWQTWETWGWFRHFCRLYSPYLRQNVETLSITSIEKLAGSTDPAASLIRKTWNVALGQE